MDPKDAFTTDKEDKNASPQMRSLIDIQADIIPQSNEMVSHI